MSGHTGLSAARVLDGELARRVGEHDIAALREVYDRHGAGLARLARRVAGDRATAEEIVQDVFVRLWRRSDSYDSTRGSLGAWLFMMCHSIAVDAVRKRSRQVRRDTDHATDLSGPGASSAAVQGGLADDDQYDGIELRAAVGCLPQAQRAVVELAYFGGLTYRETAERLGIPEGTAKSQVRAALLTLRRRLAPELVA